MKKNIYLILAEENIFHPYYLLGIIEGLDAKKYKIVGVTKARDRNKKGLLYPYKLQKNIWGYKGFLMVGMLSAIRSILGSIDYGGNYSLEHICRRFDIPIRKSFNVNEPEHLRYLKKRGIDIIISSNGHIFKDELLNLPRIACINRHTALLPAYGGVLPVFWAMLNREKKFGVSIHYMVKKIDEGKVIYQKETILDKKNSFFKNYVIGFKLSIGSTLKALQVLESKKKVFANRSKQKITYYSLPSESKFEQFRSKRETIKLSDLKFYLVSLVSAQ